MAWAVNIPTTSTRSPATRTIREPESVTATPTAEMAIPPSMSRCGATRAARRPATGETAMPAT